jgi:hypothetical protein
MSRDAGQDELLIVALAGGATYAQAAGAARCSVATVGRRLRDTGFRERVVEARREHVENLRARLVAAAPAALDALVDLLDAEGAVRLGAARAVLDHALGRPRRSFELDQISGDQIRRLVSSLVGAALEYVPEDRQELFLLRAEAVCRAA